MTFHDLQECGGICVELHVGREIWLATLELGREARLSDFRPTNEDPFERAPSSPVIIDPRLLSALEKDGRDRLIAEASWLAVLRDDCCAS